MKYFGEGLSEKHKELSRIIRKEEKIEQAKELFLEIRSKLPSFDKVAHGRIRTNFCSCCVTFIPRTSSTPTEDNAENRENFMVQGV